MLLLSCKTYNVADASHFGIDYNFVKISDKNVITVYNSSITVRYTVRCSCPLANRLPCFKVNRNTTVLVHCSLKYSIKYDIVREFVTN